MKNSHWEQYIFEHTCSRLEAMKHATEGRQRTLRTLMQMLTQTQDANAQCKRPISVDLSVVRLFSKRFPGYKLVT